MAPTEKEKMLAGMLYLADDPELVDLRRQARDLTALYNTTGSREQNRRLSLLQTLLGTVSPTTEIELPFFCDYGFNIHAGDRLYLNTGCIILDCCRVEFGEDVLCGPAVQIYTATHPTDPELRRSKREYAIPVRIGNNVWIGGGAIVCPGVEIGDNTVIGAGSVVVKSVPANVVAVGNPCRVLQ